jgi:hypothetical protein
MRVDVKVADRASRTGTVTVYDGSEIVYQAEFVNGQIVAWMPPGPSEEVVQLAKLAVQRALIEGP